MRRNSSFLYKALELLECISIDLGIAVDENSKHWSIISGTLSLLKDIKNDNREDEFVIQSDILRANMKRFVESLEISNLDYKIGKFIFNKKQENIKGLSDEDISVSIYEISDYYLVWFLMRILCGVTFTQRKNLLLVKYNKSGLYFGYNNLYNCCRGKVIDLNTGEIVLYPYDKFFNLNEGVESSMTKISKLVSKAKYMYVLDKLDGTLIASSKYNNKLLITTNGGMDNEYTSIASKLVKEKYKLFEGGCNPNYTYIFELIHPSSAVVVDYKGQEKLVLTGIRDLKTQELLLYEDCLAESKRLGLEVCDIFEIDTLEQLVEYTKTVKGSNREGYVVRIVTDNDDIVVKLKIDEYCMLHKSMLNDINATHVFELIQNEILDDALAKIVNSDVKSQVNIISEEILSVLDVITESLECAIDLIKKEFDINCEDMMESEGLLDKNTKIKVIAYIESSMCDFYDKSGCKKYFVNGKSIEDIVKNINKKEFRNICEKHNIDIFKKY